MFKPSQPMMARLRLTTKQVNGGYYKGTRTGSMGYFDPKGNYVIDWKKVRTYVVPEGLDTFKLTPFVSKRMDSTPSVYKKQIERNGRTYTVIDSMKGTDFLDQWYSSNPDEVLARETAEREAMDDSTTSKQ
ncbi:uncharacterized protein N7473_000982 [Penicillium subrubescens]|uniref:54S ribosomal protein L27, mitochondrial n=1 Tax=Penicillium subrubescens TaxID=1316194 RepID=A0A1Q5UP81_9EURO|nr:uncharacterized protein N7473_000982 [Penicillium subrubescens]KAJ5911679.1 hypothetical protein N7473_000982 [Penicillium subrubescens]OKP14280.1 54S ribosomal protein L27, mitochondrial [Penicillium subrubescens]